MANDFLTDLGASLNIFNQGVQQFATQRAIAQANDQVQSIRDSGLAEDEKQQQFRNLAQDMTMRFMSAGAPAAQIQQFQETFAPKPPQIQTAEQGVLVGNEAQRTRGQKLIEDEKAFKRELEFEKSERALDIAGIKALGTEKKAVTQALKDFKTVAKNELDGLDSLAVVPDNASNNLEYVTGLKALIKRTDPRISDADFKLATPNTDLQSRGQRIWDALINNKPLPQDQEAVQLLTEVLKKKTEARLEKKLEGYSRSASKQFTTTGQQEFKQSLSERWAPHMLNQSQAQVQQAGNQPATPNTIQPNVAPSTQVGPSKYFR